MKFFEIFKLARNRQIRGRRGKFAGPGNTVPDPATRCSANARAAQPVATKRSYRELIAVAHRTFAPGCDVRVIEISIANQVLETVGV